MRSFMLIQERRSAHWLFNSAFNSRTKLLPALEPELDSPELIWTSAFERPKLHCLKAGQILFNHNSQQVIQVQNLQPRPWICMYHTNECKHPLLLAPRKVMESTGWLLHTAIIKTLLQGHGQHSSSSKLQINTLPSQRVHENSCSAL